MRIVVFGATGMIGSRITDELKRRGHEVTGASRGNGVDITDIDAVADTTTGTDAVVNAVSARGADYTLADVALSLTGGLRRAGVQRVVIVGGAGSLEVAPGVRLLDTPEFPAEFKSEAIGAAVALDFYRGITDLDWTYVSPAALIHPGERTGRYRLDTDHLLVDESGQSEISAEDYAVAVADLLEHGEHARERVGVAW
jgi:putative NADH-flavin reductase